jgi:hypothetical protein
MRAGGSLVQDHIALPPKKGEHDEPVYLTLEDALEIFAAIIGGTTALAADQLRSRDVWKERWDDRRATPTMSG